ncbi:rhodanese-like domain-containing protein [Eggerthia catenaformis]|uniref:rhodanese-like domain-containing protein n=1 Tax=Eggerthia catenaformis TaxID=31973 RepID=UPI0028EF6846|nr:rhodanese-like domain-containing protein [Eggerthia catenaformis]
MSVFDQYTKQIEEGMKEYKRTSSAILIDVRETDEYSQGHIPESINIPLSIIEDSIEQRIENKDIPLFLYCFCGARSEEACLILRSKGYSHIKNIGGIQFYQGTVSI